jgi:hypothetical protein
MPGITTAKKDAAALGGPLAGVTFLGGIAGAIGRSELPYPRPGASADEIRGYFGQDAPPRISATGQLASAASLAGFTRAVARLAGRSGRGARELRAAALAGGGIAAASLTVSGLSVAALARGGRDDRETLALHRRAFLAGGPAHGVGFGLLLGALGLAGHDGGELPRPLATAAVAVAVPNLLAPLYLLAEPFGWLIPIGRFPGLVISAIAGTRLGRG